MMTRREVLQFGAGVAGGAIATAAGCTRPERGQVLIHPAAARMATALDWLDSRHSFSFGGHHDPTRMGFRALRVLNEDRVRAGQGFPLHPHRDMEILSYVLEGALEHRDSMGNGSVIRPGEVQRMSAGTGILHSEYEPSGRTPVHFLQIWLLPERQGVAPGYAQRAFPAEERRGRLRAVAAGDGRDGALAIGQDVVLYAGLLGRGERVEQGLSPGRHAWVQVARGAVVVNGRALRAGDGAALSGVDEVRLTAQEPAEVLLFDLA